MKFRLPAKAILFLILASGFVQAQNPTYDQILIDFHRKSDTSKVLAIKLYPDVTKADSQLVHDMVAMDKRLNANNSTLYSNPFKPLILSILCAQILNISPQWQTLTEAEREEAFQEMSDGLLGTKDFTTTPNLSSPSGSALPHAQPSSDSIHLQKPPLSYTDSSGQQYLVSYDDYKRLFFTKYLLDQQHQKIDELESQCDTKANRISQDRETLDNSDSAAVDEFNAKVDAYNTSEAYLQLQRNFYNNGVDDFNKELQRVGKPVKPVPPSQ